MEVTGLIIAFLCIAHVQISLSQEQQCSVVVSRNLTNPVKVSLYNAVENFIKEEEIIKPVSDYLNAGQLDVFVVFSVDYNGTMATVKLENITLETDSNNSDPDFFIDEYHNVDKNKTMIQLRNLLNKQNNTNIYEIILSDKTLNAYLQKIINCNMKVHATVTSQDMYINFVEVQYDGKNGCSLLFDGNNNQRQKRSSNNGRQDRNLDARLRSIKDDGHKSIINNGLSVRSISVDDDDCSDKRSAPINEYQSDDNDDYNSDNCDSSRRGVIVDQPVCDQDQETPMRRNVARKTGYGGDSECLLTKTKRYIMNLSGRFVKFMYIQITRIIDMFLGLERTDPTLRRYIDDFSNPKKFSPEAIKKEVLPDVLAYFKRTTNQIATKLIKEMDGNEFDID